MVFLPTPVQTPRIPIWVGVARSHRAPPRRAARWEGVTPYPGEGQLTPEDLRAMLGYVRRHGAI